MTNKVDVKVMEAMEMKVNALETCVKEPVNELEERISASVAKVAQKKRRKFSVVLNITLYRSFSVTAMITYTTEWPLHSTPQLYHLRVLRARLFLAHTYGGHVQGCKFSGNLIFPEIFLKFHETSGNIS